MLGCLDGGGGDALVLGVHDGRGVADADGEDGEAVAEHDQQGTCGEHWHLIIALLTIRD